MFIFIFIYIYASGPHFLPGVCGSRSIPSGTARMPKGKGKNNTEESDESEYTEVTDEGPEEAAPTGRPPRPPTSAAAKKSVPVGRVSLSSSDVSSEEADPPARTKPSGASSKKARNPSSSESEAPGPGKGGKGKQTFQRCPHCWAKVSTGARCLQQHQRWNSTCIAWRGVDWTLAKEKGQRKKARREQQAWERYQQEAKGASAPRSTAAASAPLPKEKKRRKKHNGRKEREAQSQACVAKSRCSPHPASERSVHRQ